MAGALCVPLTAVLAVLASAALSSAQVLPPGPNHGGVYIPPNPGDANYRTFFYNDRRYGSALPANYNPFDPYARDPFPNRNPFDNQNPQGVFNPNYFNPDPNQVNQPGGQLPLPGVLAGWRSDLQGKLRPDSLTLDKDVHVQTTYGQVQGFKTYLYDNPDPLSGYRPGLTPVERVQGIVHTFLGIPYAQPPVNEGRFRPPRAHRGWQLIQAVDFGPACPQPVRYTGAAKGVRDMDEDCLYLNVYSRTTVSGLAQKFPVMVYIHGGEYYKGASNTFPGHVLAAFYDVVVVTINYRLGALGFLCTADTNSPGNYGVLDQAMAINWVYDNIDAFNGDRKSITLFGPGAGAASAGLLMVAPRTRDLVTRVIAQSGSALSDWGIIIDQYRAVNTSRVFGQVMGCSIEPAWKLVDCLRRGRSAIELGNAEFHPAVGPFPWGPVLDRNFTKPGDSWYHGWKERDWHFLNRTPEDLIKQGQFNRGLSYMSGVTSQEAAYIISQNESLVSVHYEVNERFMQQKIREMVARFNYTLNPGGVYEAIKYMYTYHPDPRNVTHIREQYIHMMSDYLYRAPNDKIVKLLVEQNIPVYMYVMNTTVEALKLPEWRKYPHDIEHLFLTGAPFMDVEFFPKEAGYDRLMWTENDRNMSHFFMKAFSDFARYGNPTHSQILGLHFELARPGQLKYLNLNTTFNSSIYLNYRQTESAFWTMYLPTVIGHLVPTYPPTTEWWEPRQPLQIAFWSVSAICLLLVVAVVACCILWRNAKRQQDRYYSGDLLMMRDESEITGLGAASENPSHLYEYRDTPSIAEKQPQVKVQMHSRPVPPEPTKAASVRTGSNQSLKDAVNGFPSGESRIEARPPLPQPVAAAPVPTTRPRGTLSRTHIEGGIPQTEV